MPTATLSKPNVIRSRIPAPLNIPGKVRLVKDVLRVGRWKVSEGNYWNVTSQTLDTLVSNFNSQLSAGHRHPLQWGHGLGDAARDGIDDIRQLWREGDTLFMAVYVAPGTAKELTAFDRQVSVRVLDEWETHAGERWDDTLVHVAVVDHGAVSKQQPFKELSAKGSKARTTAIPRQRRFRQLAASTGGKLDVPTMTAIVNRMLSALSKTAKIPNGLNDADFLRSVDIVLNVILGPEAGGEAKTASGKRGVTVIDNILVDNRNLSANVARSKGRVTKAGIERAKKLLGVKPKK